MFWVAIGIIVAIVVVRFINKVFGNLQNRGGLWHVKRYY